MNRSTTSAPKAFRFRLAFTLAMIGALGVAIVLALKLLIGLQPDSGTEHDQLELNRLKIQEAEVRRSLKEERRERAMDRLLEEQSRLKEEELRRQTEKALREESP